LTVNPVGSTIAPRMAATFGWISRFAQPLLVLLTVALLTPAFAPMDQSYLAWIGLIPWLAMIRRCRSQKSAFLWSWAGGTLFFVANMWWMADITLPGMIALMVYCGIYWAVFALVVRGAGLLDGNPIFAVLAVPAVWVCCEWLRGIVMTGLPWLYLGHAQSPVLPMCQIADITGVYGISFWVVAINTLALVTWLQRRRVGRVVPAAVLVGSMLVGTLIYGILRIDQTPANLTAGPVVAVVQPNFPQSNSGAKPVGTDVLLDFHCRQTLAALRSSPEPVDLVVWSETMMPSINRQTVEVEERSQWDDSPGPAEIRQTLSNLTADNHVALLTGGSYAQWSERAEAGGLVFVPTERHNTAYFFDRDGHEDDSLGKRYDKIHLVPFGEFVPFAQSFPWLHKMLLELGPRYYAEYQLVSGQPDALTVFQLPDEGRTWRFSTPICFEDIDSRLCADMVRAPSGGQKRVDFLVNLTNDGWFKANENAQHMQDSIFRCIENRVPMARSVNTGISGFIDSVGRMSGLLPARTIGTSVSRLMLDRRRTFYTQWGDLFAFLCIAASAAVAVAALWRKRRRLI
jgi:apolipoprotein N-acyltransferase